MADTQANKLISLVRQTNLENLLEVRLPLFEVKKSSIEAVAVGDLLMLPMKEPRVEIISSEQEMIANGLYGVECGTPSILITNIEKNHKIKVNSKKYNGLAVSLGQIEKKDFKSGTLHKLTPYNEYTVKIAVDEKRSIYGDFVRLDEHIAIEIKKIS